VQEIETEYELDVLRRLGVRHGQGYHLGRPAPLEALADRPRQLPAVQALRKSS
jgi:EAL domain-containing protein (putative c-di-GMP-specific phosphodiesterase class I)